MTRACVGLLVTVPTALGLACDGAERREAEVVVAAIARLRAADDSSKPAMIEALKATRCSVSEICKVRDDCAAAGEATAKALSLKADVERGLHALEEGAVTRDSARAKELPSKLDEAERWLKQGHEGLLTCDLQVQALRRKHRIAP